MKIIKNTHRHPQEKQLIDIMNAIDEADFDPIIMVNVIGAFLMSRCEDEGIDEESYINSLRIWRKAYRQEIAIDDCQPRNFNLD